MIYQSQNNNGMTPKYHLIKTLIMEMVEEGKIKPGERIPSEYELAEQFNVNRWTANKAITQLVNDGILYREHGKGTFVSKLFHAGKGLTIYIMSGDPAAASPFTDPLNWFLDFYILQGIIEGCKECKCQTQFVNYNFTETIENGANQIGVILMDPNEEEIRKLSQKKCLVVVPYRPVYESECVNIITDWEKAAYEATRYLLELGHQQVALIRSSYKIDSRLKMRLDGYQRALNEKGLYVDELQYECKANDGSIKKAVSNILKRKPVPTGFYATCDVFALEIIKVLEEYGYNIPRDFSVTGFGDAPEAGASIPGLTTVHTPIQESGYESVKWLLQILEKGFQETQTIVLPPKLVVRESCAPPGTPKTKRK